VARADSVARARQDSINRAQPGYVVDSILPLEEQLRRFRIAYPEVTSLETEARSRDALIRAVVSALQASDTARLAALAVSPSEYAWLLYPTSEHASGPMAQAPQLAWYMLSNTSEVGLRRALDRLGGRDLRVRGHGCAPEPVTQGRNAIWRQCAVVRTDEAGQEVRQRLFGSLVERDGRWKVLSFSNGF
jgi:hypothetical protein